MYLETKKLITNNYYSVRDIINISNKLLEKGSKSKAIFFLESSKAIHPNTSEIFYNLGCIYLKEKKYNFALREFKKAVKLDNLNKDYNLNLVLTYFASINILIEKKIYNKAITYLKVVEKILIKIKSPELLTEPYLKLGYCYQVIKKFDKLIKIYKKMHNLPNSPPFAQGLLYQAKLDCAEWENISQLSRKIEKDLENGSFAITPFMTVLSSNKPKTQYLAAKNFSKHFFKNSCQNSFLLNKKHNKPKVAFLSSDLYDHATSRLIYGLFKNLNKNKFEYHIFSYGTNKDKISNKIRNLFKNYHDVSNKSDMQISNYLRNLEIDISIDLKGHTKNSRLGILSSKPTPIQISYLGYPGTLGTNFIDYLILDKYLVNKSNRKYITENIIYLPNCYQCNDFKSVVVDKKSEKKIGLPDNTFVFSGINNHLKLNKKIIKVWSNILNKCERSVLWLLDSHPLFKNNLINEFKKNDLDENRIIFAPRISYEEHLERLRHADLFLDTFPCNAHTTASEHIWSNVPIITVSGKTIASRVAGSIAKESGIKEIICKDFTEYEKKAIYFRHNNNALKNLKNTIINNKIKMPIYDTKKITKKIEDGLDKVWEKFILDKKNCDIYIK